MIDLDRNAAAPLRPEVARVMAQWLQRPDLGNPSSIHGGGQASRAVLEDARRGLLASLGAAGRTLVFTSGGTEAVALALMGTVAALGAQGKPCGVVTSPLEHPAVLGAVARLEGQGVPCRFVPVDRAGRIEIAELLETVRGDETLGLVSLSCAHHELGNTMAMSSVARQLHAVAPHILVHTDAAQAFGRMPSDAFVPELDLISVASAKIGGPPGIGAVVMARGVPSMALWGGGKQERGLRPGSESWLLAAGFAEAARLAAAEAEDFFGRVAPVADHLRAGLEALGARVYGDRDDHSGNTVLAAFPGVDGQLVVMALDLAGVRCSTGAACSAGTLEPSAVLMALGCTAEEARGALRFSLGRDHTAADIDQVLALLPDILGRVREHAAALGGTP